MNKNYILNDNFKRWFGNSKVVDNNGNPLVCYHGSYTDIKRFDKLFAGYTTGNNVEKVFFFTPSEEVATDYSIESQVRQAEGDYYDMENPDKTYKEYEYEIREHAEENLHLNPCFLSMKNPFIYDFGGGAFNAKIYYTILSTLQGTADFGNYLFDENIWAEISEYFEKYNEETDEYEYIVNNYDGCIFTNVMDSISEYGGSAQVSDEYIIWNPKQIKSVYNKGLWSLENENIDESTINESIQYNDLAFNSVFNNFSELTVIKNPSIEWIKNAITKEDVRFIYNTSKKILYVWNGSKWIHMDVMDVVDLDLCGEDINGVLTTGGIVEISSTISPSEDIKEIKSLTIKYMGDILHKIYPLGFNIQVYM